MNSRTRTRTPLVAVYLMYQRTFSHIFLEGKRRAKKKKKNKNREQRDMNAVGSTCTCHYIIIFQNNTIYTHTRLFAPSILNTIAHYYKGINECTFYLPLRLPRFESVFICMMVLYKPPSNMFDWCQLTILISCFKMYAYAVHGRAFRCVCFASFFYCPLL